jgi:hypothetical protein
MEPELLAFGKPILNMPIEQRLGLPVPVILEDGMNAQSHT